MKQRLVDLILLTIFGTLMFISKLLTDLLPNIHLIAMFIVVFTVVFRAKALLAIYIFVFLTGLYGGFQPWWLPYLYIWAVLWAVVMLLPKNMKPAVAAVIYSALAALHGFCFGLLYSPAQALLFGLDFKGTVAWIIAGLPFDFMHGLGNIFASLLCLPLITVLKKALNSIRN